MSNSPKKIAILTRHYPPNKNINGILACEMANYLQKDFNCECTIICMDTEADGNKENVNPVGKVIKLSTYFKGKNKFSKLFALINEGYRLVRKAKKSKSDLIICTTSPPLLIFWASMLFGQKNKWALWSLDLFPEAFLANKQMKASSPQYKFLYKKTYKNAPNHLIALGDEQAKNIKKKYNKEIPTLILPAGVVLNKKTETGNAEKPEWFDENKIILGYFGNVGVAHNPYFIEKSIKESHNQGMKFILAIYGVNSERVKNVAKKYDSVTIIENGLPQEHLSFINVHLVTLMPSFTHIAVPSKAVTAISVGRPILFCGDEKSDNWQMFKKAGWLIDENKNIDVQIEGYIATLKSEDIEIKSRNTEFIYSKLQDEVVATYQKISELE